MNGKSNDPFGEGMKEMLDTARDNRSDRQLVQSAAQGDSCAFEMLVERHFESVYYTALARLTRRESAEDLAQEVFLRAYLHLGDFADADRFGNWVCRVARNLAEDWRRRNQVASRLVPMVSMDQEIAQVVDAGSENARDRLEREQREQAVARFLEALAPETREIILLHYAQGLSEREIARRLRVHHTTVRYHHQRALAAGRTQMQTWLAESMTSARPTRHAAAKAAAVAVGVAAMSSSSKAALAASAASSMPLKVKTAATLEPVAKPLFLSLANWKAIAFAGAGAMTKGKILGGAALAIVAMGAGGVYYADGNPNVFITPSIHVQKSTGAGSFHSYDRPLLGQFGLEHAPLDKLLHEVAGGSLRLILAPDLPEEKLDVKISGAFSGPDALRPQLLKKISEVSHVVLAKEMRTTDVYVLKNVPGISSPRGLTAPAQNGKSRFQPGRIHFSSSDRSKLATALELVLNKPVIIEADLPARFGVDLRWHPRKPEMLPTSLRDQLGLEMTSDRRPVEMTVARAGAR